MSSDRRPRIGISECLVGRAVRHDGGHKRSAFVCELLASFVDLVTICPEVEVGMGVPRESVRLVAAGERVEMIGNQTGTSFTASWRRIHAPTTAVARFQGHTLML